MSLDTGCRLLAQETPGEFLVRRALCKGVRVRQPTGYASPASLTQPGFVENSQQSVILWASAEEETCLPPRPRWSLRSSEILPSLTWNAGQTPRLPAGTDTGIPGSGQKPALTGNVKGDNTPRKLAAQRRGADPAASAARVDDSAAARAAGRAASAASAAR